MRWCSCEKELETVEMCKTILLVERKGTWKGVKLRMRMCILWSCCVFLVVVLWEMSGEEGKRGHYRKKGVGANGRYLD
jgi:hypothetical protein